MCQEHGLKKYKYQNPFILILLKEIKLDEQAWIANIFQNYVYFLS